MSGQYPARVPSAVMDLLLILVVILVVVLVWRGPRTLPKLGAAFGRGVREVRREVESKEDAKPEGDDQT